MNSSRRAAERVEEYAYQYDDIGNRITSLDLGTNHTYTANSLNQYTQISNLCDSASLREEFIPVFDLDGNQTLIKTATGVWQVTYNGENRPVLWECGSTNITMKFDRMGRRVEYVETVNGVTNTHHRFVYDGYVCIQRLNAASNNAIDLVFGWDPSEPVATRPLILQKYGAYSLFYTHDGNKNVSELVFFQQANGIAAHYEYAPFGAVTATGRSTPVTAYDFREYNPFRFSSEYLDNISFLNYYSYRHYNSNIGRWLRNDPKDDKELVIGRYLFCNNDAMNTFDYLGRDAPNLGGSLFPRDPPDKPDGCGKDCFKCENGIPHKGVLKCRFVKVPAKISGGLENVCNHQVHKIRHHDNENRKQKSECWNPSYCFDVEPQCPDGWCPSGAKPFLTDGLGKLSNTNPAWNFSTNGLHYNCFEMQTREWILGVQAYLGRWCTKCE